MNATSVSRPRARRASMSRPRERRVRQRRAGAEHHRLLRLSIGRRAMLARSATFRRQYARIAGAPHLSIVIRSQPVVGSRLPALTSIRRADDNRVEAVVSVGCLRRGPPSSSRMRFEHIIEQLDGVDLPAKARLPGQRCSPRQRPVPRRVRNESGHRGRPARRARGPRDTVAQWHDGTGWRSVVIAACLARPARTASPRALLTVAQTDPSAPRGRRAPPTSAPTDARWPSSRSLGSSLPTRIDRATSTCSIALTGRVTLESGDARRRSEILARADQRRWPLPRLRVAAHRSGHAARRHRSARSRSPARPAR